MSSFYTKVAELLASGEKVAMASIAMQKGSSPRSRGARCAIRADGSILGTIGGGLLEATAQEAGVEALGDGRLRYIAMNLDNDKLAGSDMICGGALEVMVVPWGADELAVAEKLAGVDRGLFEGTLLTSWDNDSGKAKVDFLNGTKDASIDDSLKELLDKTISTGRTNIHRSEKGCTVLELMSREQLPLIVLGGGHVGKALGAAASRAGFSVTVVDDREEFASQDAHPDADEVVFAPFDSYLASLKAESNTFIVIVTRGHRTDAVCALESLRSEAGYVGMIGSRRKGKIIIDHLRESGISEERLHALHTPVGLPIGAETPDEIAVSILAQMISLRRK